MIYVNYVSIFKKFLTCVHWKGLETMTSPVTFSKTRAQAIVSEYYFLLKGIMPLEECLMSGLGQEMYKISLEYLVTAERKKLSKDSGPMSKDSKDNIS